MRHVSLDGKLFICLFEKITINQLLSFIYPKSSNIRSRNN